MTAGRPFDRKILGVLRDLVEHHSSSRNVAEQMGQAHNYVARILRGETKLRLDVLHRILETLGISDDFFLQLVVAEEGAAKDAAEILRFYGGDGPPAGDFIVEMEELVTGWTSRPVADEPLEDADRLAAQIAESEDRRHVDRRAVQEELECLGRKLSTAVGDGPPTREILRLLSSALAVWATTKRQDEHRREASLGLRLALTLARRGGCSRAEGMALRKSAYLLRDLSAVGAGLVMLQRATESFVRAGDLTACAKIFVDRGTLLMIVPDFEKAAAEFETALHLLPEAEWRNRLGSTMNLAHCYQKSGDLKAADACLARAEALYGDRRDSGLAHLCWNRGSLALAKGSYGEAEKALVRTLELLEEYGQPLDFALCGLYLAEAYLRQGKVQNLRALADRMLAWLPAIRGNRIADAALMEWIRCAKWGEVTHEMLREARKEVARAQRA